MKKPSIFSKDYERRMRKRKIKIFLIMACILIVGLGIGMKLNKTPIDFTVVKEKLQSWVDSSKTEEELALDKEPVLEEEVPKEEPKKEMDITLKEGLIMKIIYEEVDGVKTFKEIAPVEGLTINISPLKDKAVVIDSNQEMYLVNISGEVKNITKRSYISTKKTEFLKESVLGGRADFIWNKDAKFINEEKIVYVSHLPYIGNNAVDQYIWIYNSIDGVHKGIYKLKGKVITVGNIIPEKGIEITIDGVTSIMDAEGNIVP